MAALLVAGFMAIASLLNVRIVSKLGTCLFSHSAMLGYTGVALAHIVVVFAGFENLWTFTAFQAALMFFFGLMAPNFGSMAMEPLGNNTGPPSSVQGFCTTISRALVGFFVGTFRPLMLGFTLHSLAGVAAVLITEKSRLFQPTASGIATAG